MSESVEQGLWARQEVEDLVVRMFVAVDERDWPRAEDCFTAPFLLDMTSMVGGEPLSIAPREVCQSWAEAFSKLDQVHHQLGNFRTRVDGDRATVQCYGTAYHYRAGIAAALKSRSFVGSYELDLQRQAAGGWRIVRLQFKLKFIDGNLELEKAV
ncbi:nuclear transport factor 2 family protein [Roseateles violae]|uniref:Nuclear transport factor 2 family protein n=1 Tax=Roseateles violae TaxID=3058042 RepID=A0ABT8DWF1_9BURK|nr:nuclear transport factor 2 family protein [Pelomonas sp. PFR6]MDN3921358.1 nuclear transport factor 2 family protein [Pelomonas sp. PFR6]